jgi:uncharacterized repeat protein (TIGR01451 family)
LQPGTLDEGARRTRAFPESSLSDRQDTTMESTMRKLATTSRIAGKIFVICLGISAGACDLDSASSPASGGPDEGKVGRVRQALSGSVALDFFLSAPQEGYVGVPMAIGANVVSTGTEPNATASDVTLTTTVTGSFDAGPLRTFGHLLICTQAPAQGGITITCHADEFPAFTKDGFELQIVPNAPDTIITSAATLSVGGVEVKSETRETTIRAEATDADLAVVGRGLGIAFIGQPTYISFFAVNQGPAPASNVKMSLVLSGPGTFGSVYAPWMGPGTCTWSETSATCELGGLYPWSHAPVEIAFVGSEEGQLAITATVVADTPDPDPANNTTTVSFDVVEPKLADLAISISDAPDPVRVKNALTYTIAVENRGPDTASQAVVQDWLQPNLTFVSATTTQGQCYGGEWGFVTCDLGALAAGGGAIIQIVVTPNEGGTISNHVSVYGSSLEIDPDPSNNFAVAETTVKGPTPPMRTTASEERFPITLGAYVECANEVVLLSGTLHASFHTLYNTKTGSSQFESLFNPQGITGQGLTSGETYHATGMTREAVKWTGPFPDSYTYQNNFRIIGEKTGNNLLVHATVHVMFAPDGSVKTSVTHDSFACK